MKKSIAIGDNCIDNYTNLSEEYAGGNAVNFAVYQSQYGLDSYYLGNIGNDKEGKLIRQALINNDVKLNYLRTLLGKTAVTTIKLINNERNFLKYDSGVLKYLTLSEEEIEKIKYFDIIHFSVNGFANHYIKELKTDKNCIVYDFSDEWKTISDTYFYQFIDYGFISDDNLTDNEVKTELKKLYKKGIKTVICTRGKNGSVLYDGQDFTFKKAINVPVVDTLGAGDSFIAGFVYGKEILHLNNELSMDEGIRLSTKRIQEYGAF